MQFNSFPKILIIIFEKKLNFKFKYENQLSLKDNNNIDRKYELISIIKNKEEKNKNKEKNNKKENYGEEEKIIEDHRIIETFFNSLIDKTWIRCDKKHIIKNENNELFNYLNYLKNNIPILLIYQKIDDDQKK